MTRLQENRQLHRPRSRNLGKAAVRDYGVSARGYRRSPVSAVLSPRAQPTLWVQAAGSSSVAHAAVPGRDLSSAAKPAGLTPDFRKRVPGVGARLAFVTSHTGPQNAFLWLIFPLENFPENLFKPGFLPDLCPINCLLSPNYNCHLK